jgi:hypothetical protein
MKEGISITLAEEKVAILLCPSLDKVPGSDPHEEFGLQPTMFYRWQKSFLGAECRGTSSLPSRGEQKQV